jgi:hypothetical protein
MKSAKPTFLLFALLTLALFVNSSCDSDCSESKFDIQSISMSPKILNQVDLGDLEWDNSLELPVNNLAVEIRMNKVFSSIPDNDDCLPKFGINNKVKNIRLLSNQGFDAATPAGEDLFEISAFTFDARNFIEKADFLSGFVNDSNFNRYYFVLNRNPDLQGVHRMVMYMDFEDGTSIESNPIEVLITPIDTSPQPD